ncbi:MAG: phosphotransferase [Planctomycetes bacterium]|nr:phosphotransferase [Planctomycetota bacterium]
MAISFENAIPKVLDQYAAPMRGLPVPLGNHGGFSGARLWRLEAPAGVFCLKAWPVDGPTRPHLVWTHHLLANASSLPWLPRVMTTITGDTVVLHDDRLWELHTWMPGRADFASNPSPERLHRAGIALARLHAAWASKQDSLGICPAVLRRLDSWRAWEHLTNSGWRPAFEAHDPFAALAASLACLVARHIDVVPRLLSPWLSRPMTLQPCVCDIWHDHLLFTGDELTGLIDFGSVKVDHPMVDLARMLGSLVGADQARWNDGLAAYETVRALTPEMKNLAFDLDATGAIIAGTHWLRWLYHDGRRFENTAAVAQRLTHLTERLTGR